MKYVVRRTDVLIVRTMSSIVYIRTSRAACRICAAAGWVKLLRRLDNMREKDDIITAYDFVFREGRWTMTANLLLNSQEVRKLPAGSLFKAIFVVSALSQKSDKNGKPY